MQIAGACIQEITEERITQSFFFSPSKVLPAIVFSSPSRPYLLNSSPVLSCDAEVTSHIQQLLLSCSFEIVFYRGKTDLAGTSD